MIILTSGLLTHIDVIDEQHKELVNRINALTAIGTKSVTKEEVEEMLDFLGKYIVKHFGDEEALMREFNYPKYDWHHETHRWYIAEFHKLKEEYNQNGFSEQFNLLLEKSIINWIVRHIETVDLQLGKYITEQKKKKKTRV
jgi:hemerythrin